MVRVWLAVELGVLFWLCDRVFLGAAVGITGVRGEADEAEEGGR